MVWRDTLIQLFEFQSINAKTPQEQARQISIYHHQMYIYLNTEKPNNANVTIHLQCTQINATLK